MALEECKGALINGLSRIRPEKPNIFDLVLQYAWKFYIKNSESQLQNRNMLFDDMAISQQLYGPFFGAFMINTIFVRKENFYSYVPNELF